METSSIVRQFNALQGRLRVSVTHNCQLHCKFCHQEGIERHWVTKPTIDRKQLEVLVGAYGRLGGKFVEITGGEPTTHNDIGGLIDAIAELKSDLHVILCTNGLNLDKVFDQIARKKLHLIRLSFHATDSSPATKQLLGKAWDVTKLERNVERALELGARIQLIFTHSGKNTHYLRSILEKADRWNVDVQVVDLISSRAGWPDQELGYKAGAEAEAVVSASAGYVGKITDRTGAVLKLFRSRKTGREWEIKDYHFGVLHSAMCTDCELRSMCGEGIYALRVDANGVAKPCLLREDLQQTVNLSKPREVQKALQNLLGRMLSGTHEWTYDVTLPLELAARPPGLSEESHELATEIYKQLSPHGAIIATVPYGKVVWQQFEIEELVPAVKTFKEPVGQVLTGILEVNEEFLSERNGVPRRHTTALIKPGNMFGLFEASGLRGTWQITSGVTRFLILDTPMGTTKYAHHYHLAGVSESLRHTLMCIRKATFDYSELFNRQAHKDVAAGWVTKLLVFDLAQVPKDAALFGKLQARTIEQLKSLIYQNPPEGIWLRNKAELQRHGVRTTDNKGVSDLWEDQENVRHTGILGAMLQGQIPLFRLADPLYDDAMLPLQKLIESLYRNPDVRPKQIPFFVPDYVSPECAGRPFLYINTLSNVLNLKKLQNIFSRASEQSFMTPTGIQIGEFQWLDAAGHPIDASARKSDTNTPFRVRAAIAGRNFIIQSAQEMIIAATPTGDGRDRREAKYRAPEVDVEISWPDHIKNMLVIKEQQLLNSRAEAVHRKAGTSGV